jgi:hypothetical protein
MRQVPLAVLVAATLCLAGPASADEGTALALRFGTPGLGIELTQALADHLRLRVGGHWFHYSYDTRLHLATAEASGNADFSLDAKLGSASALLDLHPGEGGFRLSGGLFYNRNRVTGTAQPLGDVVINDSVYYLAGLGSVTADARLPNTLTPYAGIGFGDALGGRRGKVTLLLDLGVIFQGSPTVQLGTSFPTALAPGLREDLDAAQLKVNDSDLRKFRYYPVVSLGLAVRVF